ncbi:hypothetical protein K7432_017766 [Basidiobolus ranarum]|uniref:Uncharacterized protein n=1 Tax=Basidiobolus ranarum TaxID=34480 RepID=A0ABR2WCY8_9FUNG
MSANEFYSSRRKVPTKNWLGWKTKEEWLKFDLSLLQVNQTYLARILNSKEEEPKSSENSTSTILTENDMANGDTSDDEFDWVDGSTQKNTAPYPDISSKQLKGTSKWKEFADKQSKVLYKPQVPSGWGSPPKDFTPWDSD